MLSQTAGLDMLAVPAFVVAVAVVAAAQVVLAVVEPRSEMSQEERTTLRSQSYSRQKMQDVAVDYGGTNGSTCSDRAGLLHISRMQPMNPVYSAQRQ